jgi:hypothetical protein
VVEAPGARRDLPRPPAPDAARKCVRILKRFEQRRTAPNCLFDPYRQSVAGVPTSRGSLRGATPFFLKLTQHHEGTRCIDCDDDEVITGAHRSCCDPVRAGHAIALTFEVQKSP